MVQSGRLEPPHRLQTPPSSRRDSAAVRRHVRRALEALRRSVLLVLIHFIRSQRQTGFAIPVKAGLSRLEVDDDSRLRHVEPLLFFCGFKQQEMLPKKKKKNNQRSAQLSALSVFVPATQLLESASVCCWLMEANGGLMVVAHLRVVSRCLWGFFCV